MGDQGFSEMFRMEYQPVLRTVYVMLGDRAAAEDVTQEAFARLYARWARISRYERPGAWVRRVAINLALSARTRRRVVALHPPAPATAEPLSDEALHRGILSLPRAQRAAVVLYYIEDRPVAEVADILGCSASTVKVHLHRARKRLETWMSGEAVDVDR